MLSLRPAERSILKIVLPPIAANLRRAVTAQNATAGTFLTVGLSGGHGVINAPGDRWGALIPAWRSAYLHFFVGGSTGSVDETTSPRDLLASNAD